MVRCLPRIAAQEKMAPEAPEVSGTRDSHFRRRRNAIGSCVVRPRLLLPCQVEGEIHLRQTEPRQLQLEASIDELLELDGQQFLVPACVDRQLIVGERVGLHLLRRQVSKRHHGDLVNAEEFGRGGAAMPGDDPALIIDQDGIGEAEALNRVRDLADLLATMGSGVAFGGLEAVQGSVFDGAGRGALHLGFSKAGVCNTSCGTAPKRHFQIFLYLYY